MYVFIFVALLFSIGLGFHTEGGRPTVQFIWVHSDITDAGAIFEPCGLTTYKPIHQRRIFSMGPRFEFLGEAWEKQQ